jgi:hypothetical protein
MVRIIISIEASEAIARTMPVSSFNYEAQDSQRHIWLDPLVLNRAPRPARPRARATAMSFEGRDRDCRPIL